MFRSATLAAALGGLALPAAAATVSAEAEITFTLLSMTNGIEISYDPLPEAFEDSVGDASAAASVDIDDTDEDVLVFGVATAADAAPVGAGEADVFAFDPAFIDNFSDAPGSVELLIEYDLGTAVSAVGPGETGFALSAFGIFEFFVDDAGDPFEETVIELVAASGDLDFLIDADGGFPPSLSGSESVLFELAPFETRQFDVVLEVASVALAPIPLPAGGWLLLAGLGALRLRRRG